MRTNRVIHAVDLHAAGEPGRVIVGGVLDVPGATMFEKMQHLERHGDGLRKLMLREPRGYPASNCNLVLPPHPPRRRRRVRDHGADRVSADVGHEHDVHGHRAPRDRDAAGKGAGHRTRARDRGRARGRRGPGRRREGDPGDLRERARLSGPPGSNGRGSDSRRGRGGCRLGRDVLRDRRGGAVRPPDRPRMRAGSRAGGGRW